MSISLADYHQIQEQIFDATGALDPILDVDTRLFIDPAILRVNEVPELAGSYDRVIQHFTEVMKVVTHIGSRGDRMWREADRLLKFPEVRGLSIGYSTTGANGSGMGAAMRERLLENVHQIVKAGNSDPALFELVGIFEDGVGPDRVSDMIAKIIAPDLIRFTQRVCSDCGISMEAHRLPQLRLEEDLPTHPSTGGPIILVPKQILRDLPVAVDFGDVRWIAEHNAQLRDELNSLIGSSWRQVSAGEQKEMLRKTFVSQPEVLKEIIALYRASEPEEYDFENDPAGEVIWYRTAKHLTAVAPLELRLPESPDVCEVEAVVTRICEHFRGLVEDNQLAPLLYNSNGKPKHESAAQLLFFGIAAAYCSANDLDLSPESDAGRGPVDFKMSRGSAAKVVVELKLTSNSRLRHGFDTQVEIYKKAEGAHRAIFLVVDNGGASADRMQSFRLHVQAAGDAAPRVMYVDAKKRPSASKAFG